MPPVPILDPAQAYGLWAATYPPYAHNPFMQAEERSLLARLPHDLSGCRVLDAGCGSGRYLRHAQARGAGALVGLDLSYAMLQRGRSDGLRAPIVQAVLERLPLAAGWADIAVCGLTLGHVTHLVPALRELARVTRPGGTLLVSDFHPVGESLGWRREFRAAGQRYAVRHRARSLPQWELACRQAGLVVLHVSEPYLDAADLPNTANFDPRALTVPVALVLELQCAT